MANLIHGTGLPLEYERRMEQELTKDRKFLLLLNRYKVACATGKRVEAIKYQKDYLEYVRKYAELVKSRAEQADYTAKKLQERMSEEDILNFTIATDTVCFVADLMESSIMDANVILRKHSPNGKLNSFEPLQKLLAEVKDYMRLMANTTDMDYQTDFADTADAISELVRNKVMKFIRTRQKKLNQKSKKP